MNHPLIAALDAMLEEPDTPSPTIFLIHPAEVADWIERREPQAGVHVMERVGGPAVPLLDWIDANPLQP